MIGKVDPARLNPVPVTVAPVTDRDVPPVLERTMFCVEVVFTTKLPKPSEDATDSWAGARVTVTVAEAD